MAIFSGTSTLLLAPAVWEFSIEGEAWFRTSSVDNFPSTLVLGGFVYSHSKEYGCIFGGALPLRLYFCHFLPPCYLVFGPRFHTCSPQG